MLTETLVPTMERVNDLELTGAAIEPPDVLPVDDEPEVNSKTGLLGLVEILLKQPARAARLNGDPVLQTHLIPRFLAIALTSYALFSVAILLLLNSAPPDAYPGRVLKIPSADWHDGSALGLGAGYLIGMVAASGICLPSFYFFALLTGVRMTMLQIVGLVMRGTATGALVLLGILPIYVTVVLGLIIFHCPIDTLEGGLSLGLILPFLAGLGGVHAIYRGVTAMAETLPQECRRDRACFLRRLTVSWALCYTAVSPVMIYRIWESVAGLVGGAA
jgi:hypothetical protein